MDVAATVTTGTGSYRVRTRDISRGGVSFHAPVPLERGTAFTIELALVFEGRARSEPLALAGQVVWCTRRKDDYQVGAAFLSLDETTRKHLAMFLDFLAESRSQQP